jgi:hypothetical protein
MRRESNLRGAQIDPSTTISMAIRTVCGSAEESR